MAAKRKRGERDSPCLPRIAAGRYDDGMPLDPMRYLQCKVILRPNHFTSRPRLIGFARVLQRPAKSAGVALRTKGYSERPLRVREVQFLDTADRRLYNRAFILRQRIAYHDGFPDGDPEIVFKFRHPDAQQAAEMDLRPNIPDDYRIKFKAQAVPLRDGLGGVRMLYSHNVQFALNGHSVGEGDPNTLDMIVDALPQLRAISHRPGERVELVNGTIVEEIIQDLGELDFGGGHRAVVTIGLWRTRGEHRPLVGELSYQLKAKGCGDITAVEPRALARCRAFFTQLQREARDYVYLGATKTGLVYRLHGNPPNSHE
ncbi:MAG: hypothetical protein U0R66_01765 [Mycobacterium sp.]